MPVGKNALKRVTNNGYSKVASAAPDMENSEVTTEAKAQKREIKAISEKIQPKKNTAPKEKKPLVKKPEIKKAEVVKRPDGFVRYGLGQDLPEHLL